MKFPKSMHAEGWADHIDTTPSDKPKVSAGPLHPAKAGAKPLTGARPLTGGARLNQAEVAPSLSTTPPVPPRVDPIHATSRPQAEAVMRPSRSDQQLPWMVAAAGAAAIVGGLALWALNRPLREPVTPAAVVSSAEPQTQVAAATPEPPPAADRDTAAADTPAAEPAPAPEPARPG
ncbi:MAG TPA: hypothetical protein VIN58_03800, partial [Roseateles sp.]